MNTHTLILKCKNNAMPERHLLQNFIDKELEAPQVDYFACNGKRMYSNPKAIMETMNDVLLIRLSFGHLLKLDVRHAFAVIREALRLGFIRNVKYGNHEIDVVLF